MKKIFRTMISLVTLLSGGTVAADFIIDTTAVAELIELKKSSPTLPVELLDERLLSENSGGFTMLRGRFQSTENLRSFYLSMTEEDWLAIQQCKDLITALESELENVKAELYELTGVPLDGVRVFGVVGAGNTAATASPTSIVLGLEMICTGDESKVQLSRILKSYLAHELVHVVQYRVTKRTHFKFNLLELSLLEGSADYVAKILVSNEYVLDSARNDYGKTHGSRLLPLFKSGMLSFDYGPWLYKQSDNMPMDMGYWIGFKIAKAYIENGGSLISLLTLENAEAILEIAGL